MAPDPRPDLLNGYAEIGEHLGMTERQAEHLKANDPTLPTFKLGRRVCALRSKLDRWLADKAAQPTEDEIARFEGEGGPTHGGRG
jgi:hypothetical protein